LERALRVRDAATCQSIAFDRFDHEAWVDEHISLCGQQANAKGESLLQRRKHQASSNARACGTSTIVSMGGVFAIPLDQIN